MTQNLPIRGVNSGDSGITARTAEQVASDQNGIDITLNMTTGFYTLTKHERNQPVKTMLMHASRVDDVTVW